MFTSLPEVEKAYVKALEPLLPKGWSIKQLDTEAETRLEISRDKPVDYVNVQPSAPAEPLKADGRMPYAITLNFSEPQRAWPLTRLRDERAATVKRMATFELRMKPFWVKGRWQPRNDADKNLLAEYQRLGALLSACRIT